MNSIQIYEESQTQYFIDLLSKIEEINSNYDTFVLKAIENLPGNVINSFVKMAMIDSTLSATKLPSVVLTHTTYNNLIKVSFSEDPIRRIEEIKKGIESYAGIYNGVSYSEIFVFPNGKMKIFKNLFNNIFQQFKKFGEWYELPENYKCESLFTGFIYGRPFCLENEQYDIYVLDEYDFVDDLESPFGWEDYGEIFHSTDNIKDLISKESAKISVKNFLTENKKLFKNGEYKEITRSIEEVTNSFPEKLYPLYLFYSNYFDIIKKCKYEEFDFKNNTIRTWSISNPQHVLMNYDELAEDKIMKYFEYYHETVSPTKYTLVGIK